MKLRIVLPIALLAVAGIVFAQQGNQSVPTSGGSGSPGGSNGQLQINSSGSFGGITLGGDCTFSTPNITCTKTGGSAFATSATTDATNASNINSGTLAAARLPAALANSTSVNGTSIPSSATLTQTICSGTIALGTTLITTGAKSTVATSTCTGLLTTDNIEMDFNADPSAVTGYAPSTSGTLTLIKFPTSNTINVYQYNDTASSITPGAMTVNYRVVR